ncbi:PMR5 N-terminal domain [Macleaya cordata]|uniref:PMR5 N-terminal domain n=1 Tax=Macleaya cordata TaxID=56857 RepID=A0A200QFC5_MACCD|nr:PMR5 N-terminal domain [Macleaya cordata]
MTRQSISSSDRRILSLFPFVLASLLVIGTTRLVLENSHFKNNRLKPRLDRRISSFEGGDRILSKSNVSSRGTFLDQCNVFEGKWVLDNASYPLYTEQSCPYLTKQVTCQRNGRPDSLYQNWRWKPSSCNLPRWNGKEMLERLRGKRVIIVGDSLNRNQWESLSCLLYSAIPSRRALVDVRNGHYMIFKAKDYNCSVEFYWSPFLVQLDKTQHNSVKLLKLDTLSASATRWRDADIMVFNTGHWWTHRGKLQAWDFFQHEGKLVQNLEVEIAFEIAMKTWARWIDLNVNPSKTTVFFRGISPEHKGEQWCYNQTQPIKDDSYATSFPRPILEIVDKTIREMRTPVKYLNITKLSQYRKDAHPTVYTSKQGKLLTKDQREKPEQYADCNHWCLPGLPDTWNSLLFTSIFFDSWRDIL